MTNQLVTEAQVEESLHFLGCADATFSEVRKRYEALEEMKKVVLARLFRDPDNKEKSAKDREMWAYAQPSFQMHLETMVEAHDELEALKLQKSFHETRIEIWRTTSANQRRGQI